VEGQNDKNNEDAQGKKQCQQDENLKNKLQFKGNQYQTNDIFERFAAISLLKSKAV